MARTELQGMFLVLAIASASSAAAQAPARRGAEVPATRFAVRVENVSNDRTLKLAKGGALSMPLSPGVWAVHTGGNPILTPGRLEAGLGLKGLAEAGMAASLANNLARVSGVRSHGVLDRPMMRADAMRPTTGGMGSAAGGMGMPARGAASSQRNVGAKAGEKLVASADAPMLMAGALVDVTIDARPGEQLSLAFMLGHSNDGIIGTGTAGIALFDAGGRPVAGDVSAALGLWDAGTEVNEEPGIGPNQGMRQGAPTAGDPERRPVRAMSAAEYGRQWPAATTMLRVIITPVTR